MYNPDKVRGYRNMLGKSQKEMAKALGISVQSYHNKEKGNVPFKDSEKIIFKSLLLSLFPKITLEDIFF
ncbi:TPA: helix-turn-helix domain-containing protein [Streptococcus suis]|uniref:helix-turn-helix transcriptional regulator n=1 Tax=Streptococcus suis TaxID=1307 RepID=UPI00042A2A1B|nr:helix-turn-helix domain-containing protein [Streptococcus suis]HEL2056169.1 helix-turn-helix domain-containing protein [Streptococcus suis]HEL2203746.1 helix-turn-helix domain-containing protein [Streptococcus suis]HEM4972387.1 helix-turn-helix domain-containing protein [Streptococcus suis]HEM5323008.1 helix-turn-helix domain-containing protein [Streptococcus suis]HEM5336428.1 helix-turn-helix domain-containing protein [Streptococcus suis]